MHGLVNGESLKSNEQLREARLEQVRPSYMAAMHGCAYRETTEAG